MTDPIQQQLPHDAEIEAALLGCIMLEPGQALPMATALVQATDFYMEGHREIFESMVKLHDLGVMPDDIAVITDLHATGKIAKAGGNAYVGKLPNTVTSAYGVSNYARMVLEKSRARRMIALNQAAAEALRAGDQPDQVIYQLQQGIEDVIQRGVRKDEIERVGDAAQVEIERLIKLYNAGGSAATQGYSTGLAFLDEAMNGFQLSDFIVLGARPSTGKTTWAIYMLASAMMDGATVGFLSIDMTRERFMPYLLPTLASLAGEPITKNDLYKPKDWGEFQEIKFRDVANVVDPARRFLMVANPSNKRVSGISGFLNKMKREGCSIVAIDQCQNIREWTQGEKDKNYGLLNGIVGEIVDMARDYKLCVMLLHQINREGAERPTMQDLKYAGAFEEKSDHIILLHDAQRALKDVAGGWVQGNKPWHYRAPKANEEANTKITNPRFIGVDLAKTRSDSAQQVMIGFDYRSGVKMEYDVDGDSWIMSEGSYAK
jgi:replicative DNA helicase